MSRAAGRRPKALLLDFYGTLVEEDDAIVARIARRVAETSPRAPSATEISSEWGRTFASLCAAAHGSRFATQREIELRSLRELLSSHESPLDAEELSAELFAYWVAPRAIEGAAKLVRELDLPVCLVSNIDTMDLEAALASHGWSFPHVVTSEACRAYKPRPEPFEAALVRLGCAPDEVLHAGDSLGSDVRGAAAAGIPVAWVNPRGRPVPADLAAPPRHVVARVSELLSVVR